MTGAIVIPTHRTGIRFLENLLASFNGYDKYPLLIVINDYTENDCQGFTSLFERFGKLPISLKTLKTNSFELGGLYVAYQETAYDEFLLLPHSCEIVNVSLFDIVFEKYRGRSVAFGLQTGNWKKHALGRKRENEKLILRYLDADTNRELVRRGDVQFWQGHIGKYRRAVLDKMDLKDYLARNMIEAISKSELLFTNAYHALDSTTVALFPNWVDGVETEEKFGKRRLRVANEFLIKWKTHWNVGMVLEDIKANEGVAPSPDAPCIVTLTRFPDIFTRFRKSVEYHECGGEKIVVTSGGAQVNPAGWHVIEGVEPFIFSRNANLAFRAIRPERDVLLINDDCEFTMPVLKTLQRICRDVPTIGLLSPQIDGGVANPAQRIQAGQCDFYTSDERLAFVCVYIPARTRQLVGEMNESFTGYGGDDDDFCRRVREAGLQLAVTPLVSVKHGFGRRGWSTSFSRVMTAKQQAKSMAEMLRLAERIAGDGKRG